MSPAPNLTERFMLRCSSADLAAWTTAAGELGLTLSQWLRMLAHLALRGK